MGSRQKYTEKRRRLLAGFCAAGIAAAGFPVLTAAEQAAGAVDSREQTSICRLRNVQTGTFLTVAGEMAQPGENLTAAEANGTLKQEFELSGQTNPSKHPADQDCATEKETVTLISQSNQRDLAVSVQKNDAAAPVTAVLEAQTGGQAQNWEVIHVNGGVVLKTADVPGYVLGMDGETVCLEPYDRGDEDQIWELIPVQEKGANEVTAMAFAQKEPSLARNTSRELTLLTYSAASEGKQEENPDLRLLAWKSSSPDVVSVDQTGIITAKQTGTAVITASLPNGVSARTVVFVRDQEETELRIVGAEAVQQPGICPVNAEFVLTAEVLPEDATFTRVTWSSSDPSVCAIDSRGRAVAKQEGTAVLTAQSVSGLTASYCVKVIDGNMRTIPYPEDDQLSFICQIPKEWLLTAQIGGADRLEKTNDAGETWLPSAILDTAAYDETLAEVLTRGYLKKEEDSISFYPINEERYLTTLSDTPNWYETVQDPESLPLLVNEDELDAGIWFLAEGEDESRFRYQILPDDLDAYLSGGFEEDEDVFLAWVADGTITGLYQEKRISVIPASELQPAQVLPTEGSTAAAEPESTTSEEVTTASEPEQPATEEPTVVTEPEQPATEEPTVVTEPEQPATEEPTAVTEPEQPATEEPTVVTEPEQPATEEPTAVTEPEQPATEEPTAVTEPEQPATEEPTTAAESEQPATEEPTTAAEPEETESESASAEAPGEDERHRLIYSDESGITLLFPADWEGQYLVQHVGNSVGDTVISVSQAQSAAADASAGRLFDLILTQNPYLYLNGENQVQYQMDLPADQETGVSLALLADCSGTSPVGGEEALQQYEQMKDQVSQILSWVSGYQADTEAEQEMTAILTEDDRLPAESQIRIAYIPAGASQELADALVAKKTAPYCWMPEEVTGFMRSEAFEERKAQSGADAASREERTGLLQQKEDGSLVFTFTQSETDLTLTGEELPLDESVFEKIWLKSNADENGISWYQYQVSKTDCQSLMQIIPQMEKEERTFAMRAVLADGLVQMIYEY